MIDQAPVAVAMFDRDMRYIAASARWLKDYRIDCPVLGRSHYEILPDLPERWKDLHRRALGGETFNQNEDHFDRPDGSVQWLAWAMQPWIDPSGAIGGITIFSEDITARKKADSERELFVSLVESSGDFIGMCDAAFNPFFVNAAGMRMVGFDNLDEAKRIQVREYFFPEDQDYIMNEFFPGILRHGCGEVEIRFRHFKTGEALWMQYSVYSLTEVTSGRTSGYATVSRNITKQKIARQKLIEAERRLQAVMNAAPVGLSYSESPTCERIKGNPALFAQFEVDANDNVSASAPDPDAAGRRLCFLKDGRQIADYQLPLQRAVRERQEVGPVELEVILPSGRRWWTEASGAPIFDEEGDVVGGVAVTVDITERRQAQEALRIADRRKDEFLATLAHELRNPLAPISYGLHTLGKVARNEQETKLVAMMERQVSHLIRLVDELLDVARITSGKIELKKERVRLASIVNESIETVESKMHSAGHQLTVSLSPEPLFVEGDPTRLVQVFGNLLTNAAKYTNGNGHIDVTLSTENGQAIVTVRDNGIGIHPDMLVSIFDLFTQANVSDGRLRDGMGVGLALTKRLVELHDGRIEAHSAGLGSGSEFVVRLPLALHRHSQAQPPAEASATAKTPMRRVLVVDDERDVADSLVALLQQIGADAQAAYSGASAIEAIDQFKPHIIMLDIGMPGMDGYETARRIRALPHGGQFALVAVTGFGQSADRARAFDAGFNHHFVKPIGADALAELLEAPTVA